MKFQIQQIKALLNLEVELQFLQQIVLRNQNAPPLYVCLNCELQ